ncbi:hypothetical protein ES708_33118 [subsurface metagenome]
MNLQKAIELVRQDIDDPGSVDITDLNQAQEVLIEARKCLIVARLRKESAWGSLLPSETKE